MESAIKIDPAWVPTVKSVVKRFLHCIDLLDATTARRELIKLIDLARGKDSDATDKARRDAMLALEEIQRIDHSHPEETLIDATRWRGNLGEIERGLKRDLKSRNYDKVQRIVPKLVYLGENHIDEKVRLGCLEILSRLSRKRSLLMETYQSRFFRLVFDDNLEIAQAASEILYNIDFHSFPYTNPVKLRKVLKARFEENLVNSIFDRDFFRHFIKYNITIENFTRNWIWDVKLVIHEDPGFRIVKTEPDYPIDRYTEKDGKTRVVIALNVVEMQSSKKVILFLEPRCTSEMTIESFISYLDVDERYYEHPNSTEVLDLFGLVPKFRRDVRVSFGACKEFFDYKAKVKDNRKFLISESLSLDDLNDAVKKILDRESISLIKEIKDDAGGNPE
ncbi:MAG: hypothetical protein ACTSXU_14190, partial [Promethearchaeota archaeon]